MDLIEQLRRDEGVRYKPYQDSRGFWTCGVGHKLPGAPGSMDPVTDDQVNEWLAADIQTATDGLNPYSWFRSLDAVRQGACLNMAFNLGVFGLLHFPSMIHYLSVQDWPNAAAQMRSSLWAEQVGARAVRLEQQVESGAWV